MHRISMQALQLIEKHGLIFSKHSVDVMASVFACEV